MNTIQEVIEEMRTDCSRDAQVQRWADALEAAMREPVAEVDGLGFVIETGLIGDMEPGTKLYTLPPNAQAEIARLKALWYADADPRETEYSEDYRACYGKEDKP
jgi:hypothetical protein